MPQGSGPVHLSPEWRTAISRALADPGRFAMLQQIAKADHVACSALDAHACLSPATISHHLKELQAAGLVSVVREGRGMKLTLERQVWTAYLKALSEL